MNRTQFFSLVFLSLFSVSFFLPLIAKAGGAFTLNLENPTNWGNLMELATYLVNVLLWAAVAGVVFAVLYAAFLFIFSGGKVDQVKKAGKALLLTFAGLLIILFSKVIIAIIKNVLGS